jgi:hypothetical protein
MKYNAIPVGLVSIESGHLKGPGKNGHISVETEALSEIVHADEKEDSTRNVIVITFDNLVKKSHGEPSLQPLALKYDDCRSLCRDLLVHLACGGDDVAKFLCNHLANDSKDENDESE